MHTGFPYSLPHAEVLARALASLLAPRKPKKGLITDLDDTLWAGLIGEVGHEQVSWDLASHSQFHGLYQQMLGALADQGVLIAVASKNTAEIAHKGLARTDLMISGEKFSDRNSLGAEIRFRIADLESLERRSRQRGVRR